MEKDETAKMKNPRQDANPLSILTFAWLFKTFAKGYRRELQMSDLFSPLEEDSSQSLGDLICDMWKKEERRCRNTMSRSSLLRALFICFRGQILIIGVIQAVITFCIRLPQPIIIARLLRHFNGTNETPQNEAFYWATCFVSSYIVNSIVYNISAHNALHLGMKINIACCSMVYRKILRLPKSAMETETTVGKIVNLISNDADNLDRLLFSLHYLWIVPIQLVIVMYVVYQEMQWSAVIGLSVNVIVFPTQVYIGRLISHFAVKCASRTDKRLRLLNEIINGVQIIKMYTWEKPLSQLVDKLRLKELTAIKRICILGQLNSVFRLFVPRLCLFITVLSYKMLGNSISAEKVYMMAGFFNQIGSTSSTLFSMGIHNLNKGLISLDRLEDFLSHEECHSAPADAALTTNGNKSFHPDEAVSLKCVSAKWSRTSKELILKNLNFTAKRGQLVAVIGQVGSGKTSLLNAILGELVLAEGKINIRGKVAYVSQEPWIFASSIRQNILFGQPMNKKRYSRVLDVCQLKEDLSVFSHGDNTIVGEKGVKLSGGQKARISLARAAYADADIYLLDDPLSAVDSIVGRLIFEECIRDFLNAKTRILVTHQLQHLQKVDRVFILNNGTTQAEGTFQELLDSGLDFIKILPPIDQEIDDRPFREIIKSEDISRMEPLEDSEGRGAGKVTARVYLSYLRAIRSKWLLFLILFLSIASQVTATGGDYFLAFWVNNQGGSKSLKSRNKTLIYVDERLKYESYVCVYGVLTMVAIILVYAQIYVFTEVCTRASKSLHASMFSSVVYSTMSFFHSNSSGRIINRFSKDISSVDHLLPKYILDITQRASGLIAAISITVSMNGWLLIPTLIIGTAFCTMRGVYIRTCCNVKRLEGITRSPVFSHLNATLQGLATIRAAGCQEALSKEFDNRQDAHSSSSFLFFSCERAASFYMQLLSSLYICIITYTFLFFDYSEYSGNMGLVLTQCVLFSDVMHWVVKLTAEAENQMTSVERILEYSNLKQESPLESIARNKPSASWPSNGSVDFRNVYLKYNPKDDYVLRDINFVIKPNEKVGIVGRTGAGKSSLIWALLRLAHPEGEIRIDGVPTSSLGLRDLRSKICVIPQEPILFAGDLRKNLDPFEKYSNEELWQALSEVEMKSVVMMSEEGLHAKVSDGGSNFSVGQRQLLCLARALLRGNKIVVLDEATSNVDLQTDELIQETIRKKCEDCTVLIIAHRLKTVMNCDKFIVMDAGNVVEFDHPFLLLKKKQGYLYEMVQQNGCAMAKLLTKMAEYNYCTTGNSG